MKRNKSSDSFGHLMSMCPPHTEENSPRSDHMYNKEYHSMLDGFEEEGCMGEYGHVTEKKRRLSADQVKALERNFEVENKLEPERKVKLAKELGLQPRQVAVWFQNRRARWKTKQLERDYGVLKANFDSLHKNYESLKLVKQALVKEIKELKLKLNEEHLEENMSIKEEEITERVKLNYVSDISEDVKLKIKTDSMAFISSEFKSDGSSNSDSSAISNDEQSPSSNDFIFPNSKSGCLGDTQDNVYHPQFVKLEEHNFFGGDEACNFFAEEQAPSLHWYSADQWA